MNRVRHWLILIWNALGGYGFSWRDGTITPWRGTCPYPLCPDWSAKRCIAEGNCGCDEMNRP